MGSVKDLQVIKQATRDVMGVGRFHFSDRYSVFDWGEMPDHIEGKVLPSVLWALTALNN